MTDHDGDEVRELEEEAHALLDRLSHGDPNHRRLAARAREVLEQSPSPVHLQAVIAALKSAVNEMASYFRRKAEQGCPPGFYLDPDTGECVEERRGTRPLGPESRLGRFTEVLEKLRLDSFVSQPSERSAFAEVVVQLKGRRQLLEAVAALQSARQLEVIRRALTQAPGPHALLKALDASLRRRPPSLLDQVDEELRRGR